MLQCAAGMRVLRNGVITWIRKAIADDMNSSGTTDPAQTAEIVKIAFQGEHGAYGEAAVIEHTAAGSGTAVTVPCETFDDVFATVSEGRCDFGFLPIENSLAGSIHRNYDLLLLNNVHVIGEHFTRVSHCLIGLPEARLEHVRKIISHPQALAQCEQSIRKLPGGPAGNQTPVRAEPVYDTAGSVKLVKQYGDRTIAAIASRRAAELYGMQILAEGFEDDPSNYTRFLIIARDPHNSGSDSVENTAASGYKTSIVFALKNRPGALFRALSVFALRDIDLTKMESRPLAGKPWEYFFYIDLAGSTAEKNVQNALANLDEFASFLRVLGSYPRHTI